MSLIINNENFGNVQIEKSINIATEITKTKRL